MDHVGWLPSWFLYHFSNCDALNARKTMTLPRIFFVVVGRAVGERDFFVSVFFAVFHFLIFVQGFSSKVHLQASRSSTSGASFFHSRTRILYKSAHVEHIVYMKILVFAQGFSIKSCHSEYTVFLRCALSYKDSL